MRLAPHWPHHPGVSGRFRPTIKEPRLNRSSGDIGARDVILTLSHTGLPLPRGPGVLRHRKLKFGYRWFHYGCRMNPELW